MSRPRHAASRIGPAELAWLALLIPVALLALAVVSVQALGRQLRARA